MKYFKSAVFLIAVVFFAAVPGFAQETETVVIDEVVAQVNEGVITLSQIKREVQTAIDSFVQEGKSREEATSIVEGRKGELIANMINEELLVQKAKEIGLDSDVEARINQRFLDIMRQQNIKSLDELYKVMETQGLDPQMVREGWRIQAMRDMVFEREVDGKLFWGLSNREIKDYYEKNKAKFTKPETVTVSEIFLSFAGRSEDAVRENAKQILAQLKGGADFEKLVLEKSERPNAKETKGKLGTINVKDIADEKFAKALEGVKAGGLTEPIEVAEGIMLLRVDERQNASSESFFDETAVRRAIAVERIPEGRKKFMSTLRQEAYIKINSTYRPLVSPALYVSDAPAETEKAQN